MSTENSGAEKKSKRTNREQRKDLRDDKLDTRKQKTKTSSEIPHKRNTETQTNKYTYERRTRLANGKRPEVD